MQKAWSASDMVSSTERCQSPRKSSSYNHTKAFQTSLDVDADDAMTKVDSATRLAHDPVPVKFSTNEVMLYSTAHTPQKGLTSALRQDVQPLRGIDCPYVQLSQSIPTTATSPRLRPSPEQSKGLMFLPRPPSCPGRARVNPSPPAIGTDIRQAGEEDSFCAVLLSRRVQTLPADTITRSDMYALHQPPHRTSNQLSAYQTFQKASSISRRVSLACLLQRMSKGADNESNTSSGGDSETVPLVTTSTRLVSTEGHGSLAQSAAVATDNSSAQANAIVLASPSNEHDSGQASSGSVSAQLQKSQSVSEVIDRMAADVRLQRFFGNGVIAPTPGNSPWPSGASSSAYVTQELGRHDSLPASNDSLQASQPGQMHVLQRSISDVALKALESVESMKCTHIQYSQLQVKRKIGEGSIGQVRLYCVMHTMLLHLFVSCHNAAVWPHILPVPHLWLCHAFAVLIQVYLAKWQETDVAVKVITQMQNLSPLQGVHPQDPSTMLPCHQPAELKQMSDAASQAEKLGKQHMGSDLQGQQCCCKGDSIRPGIHNRVHTAVLKPEPVM